MIRRTAIKTICGGLVMFGNMFKCFALESKYDKLLKAFKPQIDYENFANMFLNENIDHILYYGIGNKNAIQIKTIKVSELKTCNLKIEENNDWWDAVIFKKNDDPNVWQQCKMQFHPTAPWLVINRKESDFEFLKLLEIPVPLLKE